MTKHYMRSDGNGGVNISNSVLALCGFILILLTALASVSVAYGNIRTDVDNIVSREQGNKLQWKEAINKIDDININEKKHDIILRIIEEDIGEIKIDIKEIKNKLNSE